MNATCKACGGTDFRLFRYEEGTYRVPMGEAVRDDDGDVIVTATGSPELVSVSEANAYIACDRCGHDEDVEVDWQ